jgi:hypothetical protein
VKGLIFILLVLVGLAAATLVMGAEPDSPALNGPCTANGTIRGRNYDAKNLPEVIRVPRDFTVTYTGTYGDATPGQERQYQGGGVSVEGPFDQTFRIADWGPGRTAKTSKSGPHNVSLDDRIPAGILVPVKGNHADVGRPCTGNGTLEIEGAGDFDPILQWAFRGLSALFFLLLLVAGFARVRG